MQHTLRSRFAPGLLALLALLLPLSADAQSSIGTSSAFGESVDLTLVPLLGDSVSITSGPLPTASGTTLPPFNVNNSVASVTVSHALTGQVLGTGLLTVSAASSAPSTASASASATVNDLAIDVTGLAPLLTIDAQTVSSTAQIAGPCGGTLTPTGTTTIESATVGGSLGVGLTIPVNPAPNTVLLDAGGIRVVLNEQILAGNGTDSLTLTVNAIHVTLTNVGLPKGASLSGDIVISSSTAQLVCPAGGVTATPTPTATATPTDTPTQTPTSTPTDTPTATATPTDTPTQTPTATPTDTPTATVTPTDTPTQTATATPTATPTSTPTATSSPTATATQTPTNTPTLTSTATATATATPAVTAPPGVPTRTATVTATATPTPTPTGTVPVGATATATPSPSPSPSATATPPGGVLTPTLTPPGAPVVVPVLSPAMLALFALALATAAVFAIRRG